MKSTTNAKAKGERRIPERVDLPCGLHVGYRFPGESRTICVACGPEARLGSPTDSRSRWAREGER